MMNATAQMIKTGDTLRGATRVESVGKVYDGPEGTPEIVLKNCTFSIQPGSLTVLLGPSGCGKTTMVRLIAGYDEPTLGKISIDGVPVREPGSDRLVVFQETGLFPWKTLLENVAYGPMQAGSSRAEATRQAQAILAHVGLKGFEHRFSSQISGGMQRRAEVARALINRPRLMMLDEPFRGLDHMTRGLMQEYYLKLFDETRMTTLFVTSEVDEAVLMADCIIIFGVKPTEVREIVEVDLPRPRNFQMATSDRYVALKKHVLSLIYEESIKTFGASERQVWRQITGISTDE